MGQKRDYNRIKQWLDPKLKEKGLSVEAFARQCGLTRTSIYFFRADKNRPNEQTMIRMCQVLGVPAEEGFAQYTPNQVGRPTNPR
jgi:transcriptional regulator with XRE-family HTH domain